ncbi:tyrosine-protein kinase, non-receptor Jak2 [Tanacetum coccineum]
MMIGFPKQNIIVTGAGSFVPSLLANEEGHELTEITDTKDSKEEKDNTDDLEHKEEIKENKITPTEITMVEEHVCLWLHVSTKVVEFNIEAAQQGNVYIDEVDKITKKAESMDINVFRICDINYDRRVTTEA